MNEDRLTLAILQQHLQATNARLDQLEERQRWIERVFETYGIKGLWLSPAKAAPLLGVSRDHIMCEIERAEKLRHQNKRGDLVYGRHYRNIQDPQAEQSTWKVHVANFDAILSIPPDQRKIG
jgi:hypothetical protein